MLTDEEIKQRFETPEEYAEFLRFGNREGTGESPIPGEFIRDEDDRIWFVSGGSQCVGCAFCNWHSGADAVYAVGSSTVANVGVPVAVLEDAVALLESLDGCESIDEYDHVEREWLIELSKAAIAAKPSESLQFVYE